MFTERTIQHTESTSYRDRFQLPLATDVKSERILDRLLGNLSPDIPWGDRQIAARKLGYMRCRKALPLLLDALPADPFWMVRCSMIQALERIGDPAAIPTLREVARSDRFQVVRSHAIKAVGILAERDNDQDDKIAYFTSFSDLDQYELASTRI